MTSLRLSFCTDGPEGDLESIPLRDHLTISGVEAWQEEDGQPQAAAQPVPLPQPSALTPPRHHTAAPGDAGWAGRQCKCSALRTFSASVWETRQKRVQDRVLKATSLKGVITMRGAEKSVGSAGGLGTSSDLILKQIHLFRGISSLSPQGLLTRTPGSKFLFPKNELPSPRTPPLGILLPSSRPDFSFSGSPSNSSKTLSRFIFTIHLASTGQMPSPFWLSRPLPMLLLPPNPGPLLPESQFAHLGSRSTTPALLIPGCAGTQRWSHGKVLPPQKGKQKARKGANSAFRSWIASHESQGCCGCPRARGLAQLFAGPPAGLLPGPGLPAAE